MNIKKYEVEAGFYNQRVVCQDPIRALTVTEEDGKHFLHVLEGGFRHTSVTVHSYKATQEDEGFERVDPRDYVGNTGDYHWFVELDA